VLLGKVAVYYWSRNSKADYWGGVVVPQYVQMPCIVERNNGVVLGSRRGNVVSIRAAIWGRALLAVSRLLRANNLHTLALIEGSKLSVLSFNREIVMWKLLVPPHLLYD
jgi:hypothetical protein